MKEVSVREALDLLKQYLEKTGDMSDVSVVWVEPSRPRQSLVFGIRAKGDDGRMYELTYASGRDDGALVMRIVEAAKRWCRTASISNTPPRN